MDDIRAHLTELCCKRFPRQKCPPQKSASYGRLRETAAPILIASAQAATAKCNHPKKLATLDQILDT